MHQGREGNGGGREMGREGNGKGGKLGGGKWEGRETRREGNGEGGKWGGKEVEREGTGKNRKLSREGVYCRRLGTGGGRALWRAENRGGRALA